MEYRSLVTVAKFGLLALPIFFSGCKEGTDIPVQPNIILIMTDDQGKGDMGFYGNPDIKTPAMDSLAKISTRFSNFYVSPVCAPTRSSLMTGRYSLRTGVYDTYNGGAIMASSEVTIAEVLRDNGYSTGIFGKWHLGDTYPHRPSEQGFDESLIHAGGGMGQVADIENFFKYDSAYFDPTLFHNNRKVETQGYCSDLFTQGAIDFISTHKEDPFFLYLSYNAPHTPLQLPEKYLKMYENLNVDSANYDNGPRAFPKMSESDTRSAQKVYGMVSNIDDNLSKLFHKVNEEGLRENTIIIFMTDNGPQQVRYTAGLRNRKGSVYEGGINVPFFISYPGHIQENNSVDAIATHMDVFPTLLSYAGIESSGYSVDGLNLKALLENDEETLPDRPLIFYWQRGYESPYKNIAVRHGNYKLVGQVSSDAVLSDFELYQLQNDPGELNNLIDSEMAMADQLKKEFDGWYEDIIQSKNLIDIPRISIGTIFENPVILNRNDAKGSGGIWAENDKYLYWDVLVESTGVYKITATFKDPLNSKGELTLRVGTIQRLKDHNDSTSNVVSIPRVKLLKGPQRVDGWFRESPRWQNIRYPFYIEIEKLE